MTETLKNQIRFWVKIGIWLGIAFLALMLVVPALGPLPFFPISSLEHEVVAEIKQLETALTEFKAEYRFSPPDRISIREDAGHWDVKDRVAVRRMWPQYDFNHSQDLNNDGDVDDIHVLNGAECLVFFLGGLRSADDELIGFAENPAIPFEPSAKQRESPYFEFDASRLTDIDDDGFYEYADRLNSNGIPPAPYLYIVGQHGGRFRSEGLSVYSDEESRNLQQPYDVQFRSLEYQIISPGYDGKYGVGGPYVDHDTEFSNDRRTETDNITNFSEGTLSGQMIATRRARPIDSLLVIFTPIALFLFFRVSNALFSIRRTLADSN